MGIANNELIKAGIDIISGLIQAIADLTSSLPGVAQGFLNILLVIGAL